MEKSYCTPRFYLFLFSKVLAVVLMVISCGAGGHVYRSEVLSLQDLEALCGLPAGCAGPLPCEGRVVTLQGTVDPNNIFCKQNHPHLPYEKFRLVDGSGRSVEVWAQAEDNGAIFNKIFQRTSNRVHVTGQLVAFKVPIGGRCVKNVKVLIENASQIEFH